MKLLLLVFALATLPACASAPSSLTPVGVAAYQQTRVLHALDAVRDTAIAANATAPPLMTEAATRKVVLWHKVALVTMRAAADGWQDAVLAALNELLLSLSVADRANLLPYISLAQTVISELR